jgi:nitronate monooxygenase
VPGSPAAREPVDRYAATLAADASRTGAELGAPRFETDDWEAKLELLSSDPLPVTSFTFGCPEPGETAPLRAAGTEIWITVASPADAEVAAAAGADVLVVQGSEAGGHRSSFRDDPAGDSGSGFGLLALIQLVRARVDLPLVAAGGISTGAGVAAVLAAGASAAQLGTAFLRSPEAGTAPVHRAAIASSADTAMTRAFTGRLARGIRNRFMDDHADAPSAYPEVHRLTAPLRAAARAAGDADLINLWAGQAHELSREQPAAELVAALARDARAALAAASGRLPAG